MRTRGMKRLVMTTGLMSFLCGTSLALADVPAALDRVPETTQIVVAVRSLESLKTKAMGLIKDVGIPVPEGETQQLDEVLGTAGLNKAGSLAVVLTLPEGMGEPEVVILVPVSDAAALIKAWGGSGEGVSEVTFMGHETGFAKDVGGGYVAISEHQASVEAFASKPGAKAAHVKALGATGNRIADSADVLVIANFQHMQEEMKAGVQEIKDSMDGMAQMMPDGGEQMGAMIKLVTSVTDAVIKDGQAGIIGLGIDDKGVNVDIAANFAEGSDSAKKFVAKGKAASLTAGLPAGDFLFAGGVDYSDTAVRAMFDSMNEINKANPASAMFGDMSEFTAQSNGYAGFVGAADLGAGLFANSGVIYSTTEPAKLQATMKKILTGLHDKSADGMTFKTEYKDDAKEIGGLKASAYSLAFDVDANNPAAGQMQMVLPMIFGPEGKMSGYTATTGNSMIVTMSKNSALLERMIASSKSGGGLTSDALVAQTAQRLPADRVIEGYIGVKPVMDMVLGVMAMFGAAPEVVVPEKIAPVGMGVAMNQGGIQFRLHVPTDVIKSVVDIGQQMNGPGMEEDVGDEPMDAGDAKPRF